MNEPNRLGLRPTHAPLDNPSSAPPPPAEPIDEVVAPSEMNRDSFELAVVDFIERLIADGSVVIYQSVSGKPLQRSDIAGLTPLNHALSDSQCSAWISRLAYQRFRTILPILTAHRLPAEGAACCSPRPDRRRPARRRRLHRH